MNKVTVKKNRNYTTISNVFLRDKELSLKAKGMLATIMSLADDWDFSAKGFTEIVKEGQTAVYNIIDELKERGYCYTQQLRDEKGKIVGVDYTFYESPNQREQDIDNPYHGSPSVDNNDEINNNNHNIELSLLEQDKEITNKEKETNKKTDYQAIVDCWNKHNGEKLGKVTKLTPKRKAAIKKIMADHELDQETLMRLLSTIPFADKWFYSAKGEHKNWKPDFDWWFTNPHGWFTKLVEGGAHKENLAQFRMVMGGENVNVYTPSGSFNIMYDDQLKQYWYIGYYHDGMNIADGYTAENRPDNATLVLNNGRGTLVWSAMMKVWVKQ